jgi:hypothetical protein
MRAPCPECGSSSTYTLRTTRLRNGTNRRRRACHTCSARWTTFDGPIPPVPPPKPRTTFHSYRGFTPTTIREILLSPESDRAIALLYGCTRQAIWDIRTGRTFRYLHPDIPRRTPRSHTHSGPLCSACTHFSASVCSFGYPEALEEPTFASECDLYSAA